MIVVRRVLVLAALPVALTVAACTSSDDDPALPVESAPTSTPTPTSAEAEISVPELSLPALSVPELSVPDVSIPELSLPGNVEEAITQVLTNLGLSQEQIDCVVEQVGDTTEVPSLSEITALLGECDIEIADLTPG